MVVWDCSGSCHGISGEVFSVAFSIRANASPFHLDWRQRFDRRLALSLAPCSFPSGNAAASDETELVPLMRTGVDLIIIFPSPAPVDGLPRGLVSAFPPAFPVRPLGFCQLRRSVGWRACSRVFCRARSRLISLTGISRCRPGSSAGPRASTLRALCRSAHRDQAADNFARSSVMILRPERSRDTAT